MKRSRALFTDGYNSFWHFLFGTMSFYIKYIIPIFVLYQLYDYTDVNLWVDLMEFGLGLICMLAIYLANDLTSYGNKEYV
jgi:hypothetical protein